MNILGLISQLIGIKTLRLTQRKREKNRDRDLKEEDANFYRVYRLPINPRTDQTAKKTLLIQRLKKLSTNWR